MNRLRISDCSLMALLLWLTLFPGCRLARDKSPLPFAPAGLTAAPDPLEMGPFPVGVKTFTFTNENRIYRDTNRPRTLVTEVWYPARADSLDHPFLTYELAEQIPDWLAEKKRILQNADIPGLRTSSVRDAPLEGSHGPYPVILFSHGSYGIRWQSTFYTVHLASHGYIVVATDHEQNTVWDLFKEGFDGSMTFASSADRLEDMPFILDRMTEFNADGRNFFYRSMDLSRVGVSGHSFGGFTTVTMPCIDSRFKVAVPHSPVISLSSIFGCDLKAYPVPILVMGGTRDRTLPWKDQYCDYNGMSGPEKYLYELKQGGHFTFSDMGELDLIKLSRYFDFGDAEDAMEDGCSKTDNVPWTDAFMTINHYATAFFNYHLRGSTGSLKYLEQRSAPPFDSVILHKGNAPEWPDGGCD